MAKTSSETKKTAGMLETLANTYHYETRIVDEKGNVYEAAGITPEESQERASKKSNEGKPT